MNESENANTDRASAYQRIQRDMNVVFHNLEQHFGLPHGVLTQGHVSHSPSPARRARWTSRGGHIECADPELAASISTVISQHTGRDYERLFQRLQNTVCDRLPRASCRLDILLGCSDAPDLARKALRVNVERLRPGSPGVPEVSEGAEYVFAVRDGSKIVSYAWHTPRVKVDDHWLHSVGVQTHLDFRNRGFGRTVVSAVVQYIASEGGYALWNCDATNVPSLRLALSVGFEVLVCIFGWEVA